MRDGYHAQALVLAAVERDAHPALVGLWWGGPARGGETGIGWWRGPVRRVLARDVGGDGMAMNVAGRIGAQANALERHSITATSPPRHLVTVASPQRERERRGRALTGSNINSNKIRGTVASAIEIPHPPPPQLHRYSRRPPTRMDRTTPPI